MRTHFYRYICEHGEPRHTLSPYATTTIFEIYQDANINHSATHIYDYRLGAPLACGKQILNATRHGFTKNQKITFIVFDKTELRNYVRYDLIVSAMTLHHLNDAPATVAKLVSLLTPGGWITLADLCKEDGSFHTDVEVKYFGFEPSQLKEIFKSVGLKHITVSTVFEIPRNGRTYPVFCISGEKTIT